MDIQNIGTGSNNKVSPHADTLPAGTVAQKKQQAAEGVDGNNNKSGSHSKMEQLDKAVETANKVARSYDRQLNYSIDKATDRLVVKVVDVTTGETIRQIPSDEMLKLSAELSKSENSGKSDPMIFSRKF